MPSGPSEQEQSYQQQPKHTGRHDPHSRDQCQTGLSVWHSLRCQILGSSSDQSLCVYSVAWGAAQGHCLAPYAAMAVEPRGLPPLGVFATLFRGLIKTQPREGGEP